MDLGDRYRLDCFLEQGRFGAMYRGVDLRLGRDQGQRIGIWLLPPEISRNGEAVAAFRRDVLRVRRLQHPNIVRVLDAEQVGDRLVVTTELADGETLRNVLDALGNERLAPDEVDAVVKTVGAALAYANEHGIAHGDVRAENVVVTVDQQVKLANFMLASVARSTPFAATFGDDTRGLARLAHELYCGTQPSLATLRESIRDVPRRRRKALVRALAARSGSGHTVERFLEEAGLIARHPPPAHSTKPQRRQARSARSQWRLAIPLTAAAATIAVAYGSGQFDWRLPALDALRAPPREPAQASSPARTTSDAAPGSVAEPAVDATELAGRPVVTGAALPAGGADAAHARDVKPEQTAATRPRLALADPSAGAPSARPAHDAGHSEPHRAAPSPTSPSSIGFAERMITVHESDGIARVDIVRTGGASAPANVVWWTSDGTARAADDYASFGRRVETFASGQRKRTLYIPLASDGTAERPESFFVHIDAGPRPGLGEATSTIEVRILDDD